MIMANNLLDAPPQSRDRLLDGSTQQLQEALRCNIADVRKRNEALSFRNSPAKVLFHRKSFANPVSVQFLNSLSRESQLSTVSYFDHDGTGSSFAEKLDMLLTWSVTPLQYGDHRPLAVVTLLQHWCNRASERATRRGSQHPHAILQDHLFTWLDTSEVAGEVGNIQTVALLYGKLVKLELFSYPNYIQRLIARGEPGLSYSEPNPSRHRHFLSWIPLFNSTPSLIYQRKVTLYGVRARETPEDRIEKEIRREIRSILPELFGNSTPKQWASTAALLNDCSSLMAASRYEQALHPVTQHPDQVPPVLPEVYALARDPNPEAPSTLANSLWIKYRTSQDWAAKVWENTLSALSNVVASNPTGQDLEAIGLRYASFLMKVDQHLPTGLDGYICRWLETAGRNEMPFLQPQAWALLESLLLFLIIQGALKTTTVLAGLVYPAWQLVASSTINVDSPLIAYLTSARVLFQKLLLQDTASRDGTFPRDIFDIQKLRTRRRTVYYEPHFSKLVEMIPLLIYIESMEQLPQELRAELSTLRRHLCQDRRFRQGAYRNLDVIREAFETSPYLMDTSVESLRKEAVAGLRMILWDSTEDGDIDDWPEVSSLLSPWKLVATTIQMQFQVKQLGRALGQENTHAFASSNLDKLTLMLFQHTKTAEEAYYVGEMAKGADPTVATKFIKAGLKFMKDMLSDSQGDENCFATSLMRLGELLRILIHVTAPFRDQSVNLLALDPALQEEFLRLLHSKITYLERSLTSEERSAQDHNHKSNLILLIRLLQFVLNFRDISWTLAMKEVGQSLATALFRLAMHFGSGSHIDETIFPILTDTLIFIYDGEGIATRLRPPRTNQRLEMAPDPKAPAYDPFKHYPDTPPSSLPADLPAQYRQQILTLIARNPIPSTIANLSTAHRDSQGHYSAGGPVINRPWEWVENLTPDLQGIEDERTLFQNKCTVKNSGSLSLETFAARMTGDSIVRNLAQDSVNMLHELRIFEDGLSEESIFARDFRETRTSVETDLDIALKQPLAGLETSAGSLQPVIAGKMEPPSRASPASSVVSRSSAAQGSGSSKRMQHSPGQMSRLSTSTISDAMDVDSTGPSGLGSRRGSTTKRKADSDDDEIQIIEGPTRPAPGKRVRAGKAPAGKTVGSKTTAGKTRASTRKR
ncbi:hypothetical protein CC1G_14203 [Coprinopsis cinerea okayama7|uniref:Uncharacterized protein n=1 Tax=Coprinopsis cinerea (strain Okayama-7 / 130 / ATCC MYA-4618 / FGSC 9003) TaxID=240176 RepID=D6RLN2_COPC7|nr:hypothetical protein CC1G_14203 [Coprinopsis cinerea okayama7\|eukprot:XP_002911670.1 hypothetical protein CC1G_14203 [Coprinopsis cinerea okayama7\